MTLIYFSLIKSYYHILRISSSEHISVFPTASHLDYGVIGQDWVASRSGPDLLWDPLLVNGMEHPCLLPLHVGDRYRLRGLNITPSDDAVNFSLLGDGTPASWIPKAKDGAELPGYFQKSSEAKLQFGAGETYDFEFVPTKPGVLQLHVDLVMLHTTVPISVDDTSASVKPGQRR